MSARHFRGSQRGVATLIVVAVLFFVLSMVAAYTNRSLIFEQRTASNQYRSTLAFEAAEAGVEWALSMLNSGRIDAACVPSTNVADSSFRQRYLTIDPATGVITPSGALSADGGSTVWASCVFDGTDWNCDCPAAGSALLAAPAGTGVFPAFRVRFVTVSATQPGIVRVDVNGCTRLTDECLDFPSQAVGGEGRATVQSLIALRGGLAAPPVAAITVRGDLDVGASPLGAYNADPAAGGITVLAGGSVDATTQANWQLGSAPGTPSETSFIEGDAGLAGLPDGERLFTNTFSTPGTTYRNQPGVVIPDCLATCTAGDVRQAASLNPGRVIWIDGDLDLDTGGNVGSATDPLVIVATGDIDVSVPVFGLVYSRAASWNSSGGGSVRGAVVAEGDLAGSGSFSAIYDADVLTRLRWQTGSFVRVPGGWRDF